jgi:hypothetical protein
MRDILREHDAKSPYTYTVSGWQVFNGCAYKRSSVAGLYIARKLTVPYLLLCALYYFALICLRCSKDVRFNFPFITLIIFYEFLHKIKQFPKNLTAAKPAHIGVLQSALSAIIHPATWRKHFPFVFLGEGKSIWLLSPLFRFVYTTEIRICLYIYKHKGILNINECHSIYFID